MLLQSKFDDYYEFEVGEPLRSGAGTSECSYETFEIVRPMGEGDRPTVDSGFDRFEDVRGDSGTRVTLRVNDDFERAGLLNENKLRPMLTKIFETSQYTLAFSSDGDTERIVGASKLEEEAFKSVKEEESIEERTEQQVDEDCNKQDAGEHGWLAWFRCRTAAHRTHPHFRLGCL